MIPAGLVVGRFQPLHLGHREYIEAAMRLCSFLYIGITNPTSSRAYASTNAPHRHTRSANPFSYQLRRQMILSLMRDSGIQESRYKVIAVHLDDLASDRARLRGRVRAL